MHIDFNLSKDLYSQYFSTEFVGEEYLTSGEKELVKSAFPKRKVDFSTGRFCARKALENIGHVNFEILMGSENEPIWPAGIVGSISHSDGLSGAVVCRSTDLLSLGLDIEVLGRVKDDMWYILYTEEEQAFLNTKTGNDLEFYTTAFFSIKESFYKFQFPITKTFLDFTDVEIHIKEDTFYLTILKDFANKKNIPEQPIFEAIKNGQHLVTLCR